MTHLRRHHDWRHATTALALGFVLQNDRDEQIAALDSQLSRTLSRFCSIAWFDACG
jgi:hypothetical protein